MTKGDYEFRNLINKINAPPNKVCTFLVLAYMGSVFILCSLNAPGFEHLVVTL